MRPVTDNLQHEGELLFAAVASLFADNSPLRDVNAHSDSVVLIGAHYAFDDLPIEKKRLQSRLIEEHRHFIAIVRALLRAQPDEIRRKIDQYSDIIRDVIEQRHLVWHSTTNAAMAAARQAITGLLEMLTSLYDPAEGSVVLVPDTNALIYSPTFSEWSFEGWPSFEILLVPMLLSELDSLKNEHRNPDVRQKAQSVIRQIKEYRRRGNLSEGVVVVANHIRLRSIASEPRCDEVLPWLDPLTPDDRMLASCIEAMRAHPRSVVVLVTGDINLQSKADFARIPFVEPPPDKSTDGG